MIILNYFDFCVFGEFRTSELYKLYRHYCTLKVTCIVSLEF